MSESVSPYNQTKFEKTGNSAIHTGSGNINIGVLVSDFEDAIRVIKQLSTVEGKKAVEKLINAFQQLRRSQQIVRELKRVHNMLHDLEIALATIEPIIRSTVGKKKVDFNSIEANWRVAARPQIRNLTYFAEKEMEALEEPRLQAAENVMIGPLWAVELIVIHRNFETCLKEQNAREVYQQSRDLLDACRGHLYRIDRQLMQAVDRLEQISDQILTRIENV